MSHKIKALVFDMDGLLFDSERIVQRSWEDTGNALGIPHLGSHIYNTLGMNVVGRMEYFRANVRADFPEEEFTKGTRARFHEIVEEEGLQVKPGARELLTYAKEHGYKLAVATSSRCEYATGNLKGADLYDYFDGFVFGDMVTRAKPDPEIYLKACEQIKIAPANAVALEDAPKGVQSAYEAGMVPIVIPDLVEPNEEVLRMAYRRLDSLFDVIPLLEAGSM